MPADHDTPATPALTPMQRQALEMLSDTPFAYLRRSLAGPRSGAGASRCISLLRLRGLIERVDGGHRITEAGKAALRADKPAKV